MWRLVKTALVVLVLLAGSSRFRFYAIGQTGSTSSHEVTIGGIEVLRSARSQITIRYTLKNAGSQIVYIPSIKLPSVKYIQTFSLLHLTGGGAWATIQKRYDVPSDKAEVIMPGGVLKLSEELSDPATYQIHSRLASTLLAGRSKIRLGYFKGATAWKARQRVLLETHNPAAMPSLEFAESDEFDIN